MWTDPEKPAKAPPAKKPVNALIPAAQLKDYLVEPGDTSASIEHLYCLPAGTVLTLNPCLAHTGLVPGMRVRLAPGPVAGQCRCAAPARAGQFPRPPVVSRPAWKARQADLRNGYEVIAGSPKAYYTSITLHHAGNADNSPTVEEVQAEEMNKKPPFADIAYHFAIDQAGTIYEGRPIGIKGGHVRDHNTGRIGIVLLTDLDTQDKGLRWFEKPYEKITGDGASTPAMEEALVKLVQYLRAAYGIEYLDGHKEVLNERNCPGDKGMELVEQLRFTLKFRPSPK